MGQHFSQCCPWNIYKRTLWGYLWKYWFFRLSQDLLWRRQWQPTPVLLPGKSHGPRSLVGYSPRGRKELDTTEQLTFTFHFPALEKEMATHSSVLAWRISGTAEPGWLASMGWHRVGHDWSNLAAARPFESRPAWYPGICMVDRFAVFFDINQSLRSTGISRALAWNRGWSRWQCENSVKQLPFNKKINLKKRKKKDDNVIWNKDVPCLTKECLPEKLHVTRGFLNFNYCNCPSGTHYCSEEVKGLDFHRVHLQLIVSNVWRNLICQNQYYLKQNTSIQKYLLLYLFLWSFSIFAFHENILCQFSA